MKKTLKFFGFLWFLSGMIFISLQSCEDNETTKIYNIGDSFGGGIIVYIDPDFNGKRYYIISALTDQSSEASWGCPGVDIQANNYNPMLDFSPSIKYTDAIINKCKTFGITAQLCTNMELNGYTDWCLPHISALIYMYEKKEIIGGFADDYYWTSDLGNKDSTTCIDFKTGNWVQVKKDRNCHVRACRIVSE
jgi:hypothetical protein